MLSVFINYFRFSQIILASRVNAARATVKSLYVVLTDGINGNKKYDIGR